MWCTRTNLTNEYNMKNITVHPPELSTMVAVYIYIYIWLLKKVQTQVICTTMVSWIIPIVRQSKTDLIHRQEMRPLRHGGSHFVNFVQNGCLHDVRDASLVCESSQFLTAWRLVLSMKPWSYIWLEFGLFSTIIAIIRPCACWALFVVTLTNTVHFIYIYIYTSAIIAVISFHTKLQ